MLKSLIPAGMLAASLAAPASAMPVQGLYTANGQIIQVFGGCGPYSHRGPWGGCRTGGQWGGYVRGRSCPPGSTSAPTAADAGSTGIDEAGPGLRETADEQAARSRAAIVSGEGRWLRQSQKRTAIPSIRL